MVASLIILVSGMIGLGEWVGQQIEQGVIQRTAATTALFVDSFIAPNLQELAQSDTLSPEHIAVLNRLLDETALGQQIVFFNVWDAQGRVLFSSEPATIGQVFPISEDLARAWQGEVTSGIGEPENVENVLDQTQQSRLLEIYSPVRLGGSNQIIAVAEFYQTAGDLEEDIAAARRRSWFVVGLAMLIMYLLLAGFVRQASDTIERQQSALSRQVGQLTRLLAQNEALHERVRRAAARTTALNERFLRRFSAELHDGPVQDLGLALLRLDPVVARFTAADLADSSLAKDLDVVHGSVQRAMQEIRSLSTGLGVPQLNNLTLPETLIRAVRVHEQRSQTKVSLNLDGAPDHVSLPIKITLYRLVQEALNNAYRHADGLGQQVTVSYFDGQLNVEVSDQGPGFSHNQVAGWDNHLGIVGMRERIESLGGSFRVESAPGQGTKVIANLAIKEVADEGG
jgi:signal transduction histidine kinase